MNLLLQHNGHRSTYESTGFLCRDRDKEKITQLKRTARAIYESATQPSVFHRLGAAGGTIRVPGNMVTLAAAADGALPPPLPEESETATAPPVVPTQQHHNGVISEEEQSELDESMAGSVRNYEDVSLQHDHPGHGDLLVHIDISSQRRAVEIVTEKKIFGR
jgi:hypothetical protein